MMGTMTSYVGSIDEDGWRKRVEENYYDPLELDAAGWSSCCETSQAHTFANQRDVWR